MPANKLTQYGKPPNPAVKKRSRGASAWWLGALLAGLACPAEQSFAQTQNDSSMPKALKKLSLQELMDVEVTSVAKHPEKLAETASAIQVITGEDIHRSGTTSLPEALRLVSNLQSAQVDSRSWGISARGFNGSSGTANKLLVMIDGRTVYTPLNSGVFWDAQSVLLEDVERIEVVSGPGGTLWGANAVNGVINIITKSARDTQGTYVSGGGGSLLQDFGAVRYGGSSGTNLFYRVYGQRFDRGNTVLPNGREATNAWDMTQGGFRMDYYPSAVNTLTLQGDFYGGNEVQPGLRDVNLDGENVLGRWTRTFSEDSELTAQLYFDRTWRDTRSTFAEDLKTYDFDLQHRFPLGGRQSIVWGAGYRLVQDEVKNSTVLAFLPPNKNLQLFSGFVQDEIALVKDRLHLTLGAKVEHNDYTGVEYQPSGRLAWRITERQTAWAAISRAVRTPTRVDRELFAPGVPPFVTLQGGTNFVSEELLAYELGYRVQPHPRLSLSVAAFYNDYDNVRSIERTAPPAPLPVMIANGQKAVSYGAELTADYHVTDWWRLRAGYTELHIDFSAKPGSTDTTGGSAASHDPNRQVSLRSSWDLPAHLSFDAAFRYVSAISNQSLPGYSELELRLAWAVTANLELSIVGQNLLHNHHAEFGTPSTRQEIPRSVFGKVTWRF